MMNPVRKPLPLALACLLAAVPMAHAGTFGSHSGNGIQSAVDGAWQTTDCQTARAFELACAPSALWQKRARRFHAGAPADPARAPMAYARFGQARATLQSVHARAADYQVELGRVPAPHVPTRFSTAPVSHIQARVNAAGNPSSISVPLDLIRANYGGGQYGYRLGISVGVNGGAAREYMFDTGSDLFNIDVGRSGNAAWFPATGAATSNHYAYMYGDGTYGYWQQNTTVGSIQFYDSNSGQRVVDYDTSAGMPVAIATDWIVTKNNYYFGNDTLGDPVVNIAGTGQLYQDVTWQQSLDAGVPPEEGIFYGTFGAGDFGTGVPGMLTKTGYIVEANGTGALGGSCSQACLIMGLTPQLRAQFLSVVPWFGDPGYTMPVSGNDAAYQFDTAFWYTLSDGKTSHSAGLVTLFDTGTPNIMLIDDGSVGLASAVNADGNLNPYGDVVPGLTLTTQGLEVTNSGLYLVGKPDHLTTGSDVTGDYSNVVTLGNYGGFGAAAIYGIGFFMRNAVMYDMQNHATGFTPFFITTADLPSSLRVTRQTGPLGLAGVISGSSDFQVVDGGIANLSGTNTYTGATIIGAGSWLGLAGPGTIADTSEVQADGVFDISRASQATVVGSLSGGGTVELGSGLLNLTQAQGNFSGVIMDGGLGGGTGGSVIISAGQQVFGGANTYTGFTGVAGGAALRLDGSLAGQVINLGTLIDNGSIAGNVASNGVLGGNGSIAGDLDIQGGLTAGGTPGQAYTLNVGGDYRQTGTTHYTVQFDPLNADNASLVNVAGSADVGNDFSLSVMPNGHGVFQIGHQYTVFNAAQGMSGQLTLTGNTAISAALGVTLSSDAHGAYLDVVQIRPLTAIGGTANQTATLAGIQGLSSQSPVLSAVASLASDADIRAAASVLSGDMHASLRGAMVQETGYLRDAVDGRMQQAVTGNRGDNLRIDEGGLNWWTQAVGASGYHDGNANTARQTHDTKGFYLGADHALGSQARLGILLGATSSSLHVDQRYANAQSNNFSYGVYGGMDFGGFALNAGAAHTRHQVDSTRIVLVPGLKSRVLGHYTVNTDQVFAGGGYRFQVGNTAIEPFLRGAWIHEDGEPFAEKNSVVALRNSGGKNSVTQGTLGLRVSSRFGSVVVHEMLGRQHVFSGADNRASVAFAGGSGFQVDGLPLVEDATAVGLGLSWEASQTFSLDLAFQGRFASGAPDKAGHLRLNWWF